MTAFKAPPDAQEEQLLQSYEGELYLMRFPRATRENLDQLEAEEEDRAFSAPHHTSHLTLRTTRRPTSHLSRLAAPIQKPHRWRRRLLLFFVLCASAFGFGLWSLESQTRAHLKAEQSTKTLVHTIESLKKTLSRPPTGKDILSLPRYLAHYEKSLVQLTHAQQQACPEALKETRTHVSDWQRQLETWIAPAKAFINTQWQRDYRKWRHPKDVRPQKSVDAKFLCRQQLVGLSKELKRQLFKNAASLLRNARVHLSWYGWCKMVWTRVHYAPDKQALLHNLRKPRCQSACKKQQIKECQRCREQWRKILKVEDAEFRHYLKFVQQEKQRRCRLWSPGQSAGDGMFHLGEYYWRIQRVLAYMDLFERHGVCGTECQRLRKTWGFRLELESQPVQAKLYAQLWPRHLKAPTALLRQLQQFPVGSSGPKPMWLPSLRSGLLETPTPRNMWVLYYLKDPKGERTALLPLAPQPGEQIKRKLTLSSFQVLTDGRLDSRFIELSPKGAYLAFGTFDQLEWEASTDLSTSHCLRPPTEGSKGRRRSVVSLYAIDQHGLPQGSGHHLPLPGYLYGLKVDGAPGERSLLLSTNQSPLLNTPAPSSPRGASLWKIPLQFTQTQIFGTPQLLSAARTPKEVILPLSSVKGKLLTLHIHCPTPTRQWQLRQLPQSAQVRRRWSLPSGTALLAIVGTAPLSMTDPLSFLLHGGTHPSQSILQQYKPDGTIKAQSTKQFALSFTQIRNFEGSHLLSGGQWGTALMQEKNGNLSTILHGIPNVRYLDPIIHHESKRLFVIQQWKLNSRRSLTFLISHSLRGIL